MLDEKIQQNDVVISSRIRLARNIADFPFVSTCSVDQLAEIESAVRNGLVDDNQLSELSFLDSVELETLERQFLLDLGLIGLEPSVASGTSDLRPASAAGADQLAAVGAEVSIESQPDRDFGLLDNLSVTINDEDHLRINVTRNDFDLNAAWKQIGQLDDKLEEHFNFAFSQQWGYLTACPANVGTGMRVSVLVHLPALVMTGQIEKVFRSVQKVNVVARGMFGDSAVGDFFRISNQATLGCNETDLIEQVGNVIPALVKYEREARKLLLEENPSGVREQVMLSFELLCQSDLEDGSQENNERIMSLLSKVRMGISVGILKRKQVTKVNALFSLVNLRHRLFAAVTREDYLQASKLRDQIRQLEADSVLVDGVVESDSHVDNQEGS